MLLWPTFNYCMLVVGHGVGCFLYANAVKLVFVLIVLNFLQLAARACGKFTLFLLTKSSAKPLQNNVL